MASQDKLRAMFNEMDLEQKGNFIDNLKKSLEGSDDAESAEFLNECIGHYTMEKEFMESMAEEAAAAAEPEAAEEPAAEEPAAVEEPAAEVEAEVAVEEVAEPEIEVEAAVADDPVIEVMTDPELDLEEVIEPEVAIEPEIEIEPELEVAVEEAAEPEPEFEPELELELELEVDVETVVEPELEPEIEVEIDIEEVVELEAEPVVENEKALVTTKSKIDFIEMEISELAENIRYKMSVIGVISHLLSGNGNDIVEAAAQVAGLEPDQPLENTSDYEGKVDGIEKSLSDFADSIRHDMKVMEAISELLSGKGK